MRRLAEAFTLLEMLVSLALLAVLMGLVGTALMGANRALSKGERYSQQLEQMRASQNFLQRALQGALPVGLDNDEQAPVFNGEPQRLVFAAGLDSALGGGLQVHTVELVGQTLQVRFAHVQGGALTPWGQPQVLLDNVHDLHLSYRGRDERGRATTWLARWPWPARLPQAVRIELGHSGPVPWATQVVALRLELSDQTGAP